MFSGDKVIVTKGSVFVRKGYVCNNMYKLSINGKDMIHAYITDQSFNLWHERLGHINYRKLIDMSKSDILPKFDSHKTDKCKTCMLTKITR